MRKVLITGASSGIGRQIAIDLACDDNSLIIVGRNREKLKNVGDSLKNPDRHLVLDWDLSVLDSLDEKLGPIDSLDGIVHSAGILGKLSPVTFSSLADIHNVFSVNVFSIIMILSTLMKRKKINANASVILISSIMAQYGTVGTLAYSMSKGAINSAVKVLAAEFSNKKIRVNAIAPGMVRTPMTEHNNSRMTDEQIETDKRNYLLGYGESVDISNLVRFLLSYEQSKWVTGSIINIDGGYKLR